MLERTTKLGLGLTFLGFFLLVLAENLSSAVFWGGLVIFVIGLILLIVSLFWKVAVGIDNKLRELK